MAKRRKDLPTLKLRSAPAAIQDLLNLDDSHAGTSILNPDSKLLPTISEMKLKEEELNLNAIIEDILASKDIVPRDLKFDDSSMPKAKNYYEWVTGEDYLGSDMPPYLEQALIGTRLFSEYCVYCSNLEWMEDDGHEAQEGLAGFSENVQLLEHGVCPKCDARRSHMMADGKLNFYNELALNAGQRCITGDTHVFTSKGIERIGHMNPNAPTGFSDYKQAVYNGTELEETSDFYKSKTEDLFFVKLDNNYSLRGTGDHPIMTLDGFKKLRNLTASDYVTVQTGQDTWGTSVPRLEHIIANTLKDLNERIENCPSTNKSQIYIPKFVKTSGELCPDMYRVLGFWIAEGRYRGISNTDVKVNEFCYSTLCKYLEPECLTLYNEGIEFKGIGVQLFISHCLGLTYAEYSEGSSGKKISDALLKSPKPYLCALLQGMYEGDGYAIASDSGKIGSIGYTSISRTLIYDIYTVLINLGIFPRLRRRMVWATNGSENQVEKPAWSINILPDHAEIFKDTIGFFSKRKMAKVDSIISRFNNKINNVNTNITVLNCLKPKLAEVFTLATKQLAELPLNYSLRANPEKFKTHKSKKHIGLQTIFKNIDLGCRHSKLLSKNRALTKDRLSLVCKALLENSHYLSHELIYKINELKAFVNKNLYIVKVKSCGLTGTEDVTYDFTLPKTHRFITQGILSHNSGKSALVAMLSTYVLHQVLKSQKPNQLFRVKSSNMWHGTFVALTYAQAKDTLWEPFYNNISESPWFQKYHELLRNYEHKYGVEIFKFKDTFLMYRHRAVMFYPAGPDKRTLRGRTRILASIDEIAYFDNEKGSNKVKLSASEVYIALERSLRTARNSENRMIANEYDEAFTGYFLNVSSPVSQRDKVCELVKQSVGSKKMLGIHKPTWAMNPDVTREALDDEFRKDHATAMRDYGAEPPLSANPFISSHSLVEGIIKTTGRNLATIGTKIYRARDGSKQRYGYIDKIKPIESGKISVMAIDAGFSNDCFAVTTGSLQWRETDQGQFLIPSIDITLEVNPLPNIPLHYPKIYENILEPLIKERNVKILVSDRWQSIKLLQDAEQDHDLETVKQYSLRMSDFVDIKTRMQQQQLWIPRPVKLDTFDKILAMSTNDAYPKCFEGMPIEHLILQMLSVQTGQNNVIKGEGLTDDIWRSMSLAIWALSNPDYHEILTRTDTSSKATKGALGVMKTGSAGTGAIRSVSSALGVAKNRR